MMVAGCNVGKQQADEDIVRVWATFRWAEILGPLIHVEEMSGFTGHIIEEQIYTFMSIACHDNNGSFQQDNTPTLLHSTYVQK